MKKFLVSMMAVITAAILVACSNASNKDLVHIGVLQYVEHPSLSATRKGFIEELKEEGYVDGKNIKIDYQNAQGDQSNLQTISQSLIEDNDVMLAIATPAAQSLSSLTKGKPILFTAVTDPVSAKLVKSMDNVGGNVTGTSDMSPINKQVELLKKVFPNTKKVGIMYTTSERNSEVQVEEAKKYFKEFGIETVIKGISSTNDIQDTAKSLMSQTEVIFIPTDNTIVSAINTLVDLSKETKVPVVGSDAGSVEKGVLFTYGTNYEALGRQTGKLAGRVLRGEKVKDIDAEYPKTLNVVVNHDMAKELGIDVSRISDEESKVSTKDDKPIAKKDKGVIKLKVNKSSKNGFSNVVLTSISQGLLWAIMAIGVFITFRILDLADLTAEGTFPLGAATTTIMIIHGINPIFATLGGFVAGMFAGAVSGFMHTKMKIPALLTGIITLTGLYSVNLLVLGSANISLSGHNTLVTMVMGLGLSKLSGVILLGLIFVRLALRATGDNLAMGEANGIKVDRMKILGYMISNGLIALSGALLAQNNGYADMNMGTGTIVNGLAAIILAEVIVKYLPLGKRLWSIVVGAVLYRLVLVMILAMNVDAQMLKLASAILLAIILYVPEVRQKLKINPNKSLTPGGDK